MERTKMYGMRSEATKFQQQAGGLLDASASLFENLGMICGGGRKCSQEFSDRISEQREESWQRMQRAIIGGPPFAAQTKSSDRT
jgi:hypothetical protein